MCARFGGCGLGQRETTNSTIPGLNHQEAKGTVIFKKFRTLFSFCFQNLGYQRWNLQKFLAE